MTDRKDYVTMELFSNRDSAEKAYQYALDKGYHSKDINIIMSEESKKNYYDSPLEKKERMQNLEDLTIGGATGAAIGSTIAALAALGTNLVLPGLGLIIMGPLAGAGAVAGGLVGTLVGLGISKDHAEQYQREIQSGGIVLLVHEKNVPSTLKEEWQQFKSEL